MAKRMAKMEFNPIKHKTQQKQAKLNRTGSVGGHL